MASAAHVTASGGHRSLLDLQAQLLQERIVLCDIWRQAGEQCAHMLRVEQEMRAQWLVEAQHAQQAQQAQQQTPAQPPTGDVAAASGSEPRAAEGPQQAPGSVHASLHGSSAHAEPSDPPPAAEARGEQLATPPPSAAATPGEVAATCTPSPYRHRRKQSTPKRRPDALQSSTPDFGAAAARFGARAADWGQAAAGTNAGEGRPQPLAAGQALGVGAPAPIQIRRTVATKRPRPPSGELPLNLPPLQGLPLAKRTQRRAAAAEAAGGSSGGAA
ncbi:hypothetical protein HYH03_005711 [Edaphochlamys debaryana]|uniref:Uncharacterized protein n=1 Tax=Edaphochlamys debaryana TaxID=47281 RepID=A0A836C1Y7_9CHLO|nr:hypothetical protein HYH03_005711 [Edaphochlamys debaryana]|eukprot:KAG2496108.1 hypothetical protein HYH03_005711 [Edaphochlamys debaryana]